MEVSRRPAALNKITRFIDNKKTDTAFHARPKTVLKGLIRAVALGIVSFLTPNRGTIPLAWGKPVPGTVDKKTARYRNHPEDGKM
ncbi:hypothetical protein [Leptospirillum ferriphilum]|jgi:hypothetical protein|uniref:hypothetical protein n=1 Tax=Leptospirillum ferriphilum TaxID=178606 RepID=UPI003F65FC21